MVATENLLGLYEYANVAFARHKQEFQEVDLPVVTEPWMDSAVVDGVPAITHADGAVSTMTTSSISSHGDGDDDDDGAVSRWIRGVQLVVMALWCAMWAVLVWRVRHEQGERQWLWQKQSTVEISNQSSGDVKQGLVQNGGDDESTTQPVIEQQEEEPVVGIKVKGKQEDTVDVFAPVASAHDDSVESAESVEGSTFVVASPPHSPGFEKSLDQSSSPIATYPVATTPVSAFSEASPTVLVTPSATPAAAAAASTTLDPTTATHVTYHCPMPGCTYRLEFSTKHRSRFVQENDGSVSDAEKWPTAYKKQATKMRRHFGVAHPQIAKSDYPTGFAYVKKRAASEDLDHHHDEVDRMQVEEDTTRHDEEAHSSSPKHVLEEFEGPVSTVPNKRARTS